MPLSDTLVIKHLPNVLSDCEKSELLKHFGAKEVKCISSKQNRYSLVFARFENSNVAFSVLHRLHQINVLGSTLSVEFAKKEETTCNLTEPSINCVEDKGNKAYYEKFIQKLTSWCSGVDFKQPVPTHLKYQYPPPNTLTLMNIIKILATVPKFYTQVLHLMNKMNLPCPFERNILPEVQLPFFSEKGEEKEIPQDLADEKTKYLETSESELSSDEDLKKSKETIPEQHKTKKKSKIKVPKFVKPTQPPLDKTTSKKTSFEEVFEKVTEKEPKKIKLSHTLLLAEPTQTEVLENQPETSGFGFIHPIKKVEENEPSKNIRDEREEERLEKEDVFISEKELEGNRIPEKDRSILPVFKNYAEGAATCRLYIKNLAKTVTVEDLRYIYLRYCSTAYTHEPNKFDIRLMQEGRMKGQAFVTLQTVELAQKALKETNGYILKDKPLVVQFARSATK